MRLLVLWALIINFAVGAHAFDTCTEYSQNQFKVFQLNNGRQYRVQRTSNSDYRIDLSISFTSVHSQMESQVRTCYALVNSYLKGPNGEHITLHLNERKDLTPSKMKVLSSGTLSDNDGMAFNEDCAIVLHQTLHLLGLHDEYKDVHPQTDVYNCRAMSPDGSIMSHALRAWNLVTHPTAALRPLEQRQSLLYPAHVAAILYPGCTIRNPYFNTCMSFATKTSLDYSNNKCPQLPTSCTSGQWLFAAPQQASRPPVTTSTTTATRD